MGDDVDFGDVGNYAAVWLMKHIEDERADAGGPQLVELRLQHVCEIVPRRDQAGTLLRDDPHLRFENARGLPLHRYGTGPFCRFSIPRVEQSGVYTITVDESPVYIGECENLARRFNTGYGNISPRNCFVGGQSTNCRINNLILQAVEAGHTVDLWFHQTDEHKAYEARLLTANTPPWNAR